MTRLMISLAALCGAALPVLTDSALKAAALLALAGVAAGGLRQASAASRHLIWLFAVAAVLMLPALSALLPGWRALPSWTAMSGVAPTLKPSLAVTKHSERALTPALSPSDGEKNSPVEETASQAPGRRGLTVRQWLLLVWAVGSALLMVRLLAAAWLLARRASGCAANCDNRLTQLLASARTQLDIRRPVQVLIASHKLIPMVWGVWHPRLLLPQESLDWSDSQLRSVLLHELAHVKRGDVAVKWLMQAVRALYWFNPLVWLAAWRLHVEGERACDDLVLASGVRPSEYAEHLLHMATGFSATRWTHACGLAMARPNRLEGRLMAVLNKRLNRRSATRGLALAAFGIALCVLIPMAMLRAADQQQAEKPTTDPTAAEQKADTANRAGANEKRLNQPLDPREADLIRLRQAEKDLKRMSEFLRQGLLSQAEYERAENEVAVRRAELSGDQAAVIRAQLQQAKRDLERLTKLRAENVVSENELERAKSSVEVLEAQLSGNQAAVIRAQLQQAKRELERLTKLRAEKAVSENELEQAKSTVEVLEAQLAGDPELARKAQIRKAQAELALAEANTKRMSELADRQAASQAEREKAEADAAAAEAQLRQAKAQYEQRNSFERNPPGTVSEEKRKRLLQILAEEIQVAEDQAKLMHAQRETGTISVEAAVPADLDVLAVKGEAARLSGDMESARGLISQQLRLLEDLQNAVRRQIQNGTATEADELKLRRKILSLKRQQAELE